MLRPAAAVIAAVLLIGPLLVAELGVRALIRSGRLPAAPSSDREADVSLANLDWFGRPDVLVVGTSSIRSALRPSTLEELILHATGTSVTVRTVAQRALSLEDHRILVRGLAARGLLPDLVILGLTPSTMTGYGAAGDWFARSELGRLWAGCRDLQGRAAWSCALTQHSALWRWRGDGERVRQALAGDVPRTAGPADRRLTTSGWLSERPVRRYTLDERVPQLLQVLPAGVPLPTSNLESFAALIGELRGHGATVVAVALPYAPPLEAALAARNPEWHAERDAGYAALGEAADLPIVTVEAYGDWWETRSQNDLRHLSRRGAGPMTRQLWEMPAFREPIVEALGSAD
jgi:hypothetical protein